MMCTYLLIYIGGLALTLSYDNLSFNKVASQSHTSIGLIYNYSAHNAVDGNTGTCMRTRDIGKTSDYKTVWWKVDLGAVYRIYSVTLLFINYDNSEHRQQGRFAGFSIYVSNNGDKQGSTLCYKDGPQLPPLKFTTTCLKYGRYVIFYNERLDGVSYPRDYEVTSAFTELCEVIVQGCQNSTVYGSNCHIPCPINCQDNICHIKLGHCFICQPGWTGATCITKCIEGWYGNNCSQPCEWQCKDSTTCNHVTGHCDGGCEDGWFGIHCTQPCVGYCKGGATCNHLTGHCSVGCVDGWYGNNCNQPCEWQCKNSTTCNHVTGYCDGGCEDGWFGIHCTQPCVGYCRGGATCNHVTGHCSVGCEDGWYGVYCTQQCEGHCRDNIVCNDVTGQCDRGCDAGWTGYFCNKECEVGMYGFDCVNNCSGHCLNDSPCNKQTGHCERGCKVGYINSDCGTKCPSGNFGMDCKKLCPGHCLNNETCDHVSGLCLNGCHDGYIGKYCNNSCQEGYYGKNCSMVCHPNCTRCRNTDGFCTCGAGWIGPNCSLECVWSYGGHCQYPCSRHCINQTCDRFNGSCLFGYSDEYMYCESDSEQSPPTLTISIAGFTVSLVINIIVISALRLRRRKKLPNRNNIRSCLRSTSNRNQTNTEEEEPHYQELKERKKENYQNLTQD
nr:protein draper isoform X2 [Crassostrea gigas]